MGIFWSEPPATDLEAALERAYQTPPPPEERRAELARQEAQQVAGPSTFRADRLLLALAIVAVLLGAGVWAEAGNLAASSKALFGLATTAFGIVVGLLTGEKPSKWSDSWDNAGGHVSTSAIVGEILGQDNDLSVIEEQLQNEPSVVANMVAAGRAEYRTRAIVGAEPSELPELESAARKHLEDHVKAGRTAVRKIRKNGESAELGPDEAAALEAIVLPIGRPAILVQDGRFFPAPQPWADDLEKHRSAIEGVLQRVGRIEVEGHPAIDWVGTGWLAANDVVMTNRHVAVEFCRKSGEAWTFLPDMSVRIDYNEELSAERPREVEIVDVIGIHETLDLALLQCTSGDGANIGALAPLPIAQNPAVSQGTKVYAVGYPAADSRRNDPSDMQRIFAGIYNVKRLQPGKVRALAESGLEFVHDCSTLGGNSGSCVLDLDTSTVVGLHFSGRYLEGNRAISLWRLAEDPILRRAGVTLA
jgi:hypothetical protein